MYKNLPKLSEKNDTFLPYWYVNLIYLVYLYVLKYMCIYIEKIIGNKIPLFLAEYWAIVIKIMNCEIIEIMYYYKNF